MAIEPCTARERMLAAYEGRFSDTVPVAPEFWYYIPARLLGVSMVAFQQDVPHWQALQTTFRHYGCEGWGIVAPRVPDGWGGTRHTTTRRTRAGRYEVHTVMRSGGHVLEERRTLDDRDPSWVTERPVKDFDSDWPAYERMTLVPAETLDWGPVQAALDAVGEDYLLEVTVGTPFIDYAGGAREGGLAQLVFDLLEREVVLRALQERYIEHVVGKVRGAFARTSARSIFVGSSWSSLSLLSPAIWRMWERPVLEAVVAVARECGGLVHHHFHGRCIAVLNDLAVLGLDCICPFERPPGGDVVDLVQVRGALAGRTTFNGNVHTVETLIRGTPSDVEREVSEILSAFAGSPRLIVGTGDQVGGETPDENIHAMVEAVRGWRT